MQKLTHFRSEDVLAEVLRSIDIQGSLYCRSRMRAPWGFRIAARHTATFHVVTAGRCWLDVEGVVKGVSLTAGDLVILPHGHAHVMRNPLKTAINRVEPLDDLVAKLTPDKQGTLHFGQGGASASLICGGMKLESHLTNPLLAGLPPFILVRGKDSQLGPWLQATVKWVEAEAGSNRPGAETVIARLSEILFILAMRAYTATDGPEKTGWLKALNDPEIGLAIALIHRQPKHGWTLGDLSHQVGLSRTAFTGKFKRLVGESPGRYLTRWRLNTAEAYLRTGTMKLSEIARLVGYESEVELSKAFKRYFGVAPGGYRHTVQNGSVQGPQ